MPKLNEILGDSYKSIPEEIKTKYKDVDLVNSDNYVEKSDYDSVKSERDQYKKDVKKRDKDLEAIQDKVKDNEELSKEIDDLKEKNKVDAEKYSKELEKIQFENVLEKKLGSYNPQNVSILKKALDFSKITRDGNNFIGLEEQINALKESDKYLFKEDTAKKDDKAAGTGIITTQATSSLIETNTEGSIGAVLAKSKTETNAEVQKKFFE
ncbi:MAG: phage scaffolding protein [Clostridiales bacterium]|nr:phage scaffolding protein [Clostridiales bacterium]